MYWVTRFHRRLRAPKGCGMTGIVHKIREELVFFSLIAALTSYNSVFDIFRNRYNFLRCPIKWLSSKWAKTPCHFTFWSARVSHAEQYGFHWSLWMHAFKPLYALIGHTCCFSVLCLGYLYLPVPTVRLQCRWDACVLKQAKIYVCQAHQAWITDLNDIQLTIIEAWMECFAISCNK